MNRSKVSDPPQHRKLSIVQWNIQSLKSCSGEKTDDKHFTQILCQAGIFCLQETKSNVTLPGYRCFNKLRSSSKSGGLCIGVERDLCKRWKVIEVPNDCEDILAVQFWTENSSVPILLVNIYDSPENSSYKRSRGRSNCTTLDYVLDLVLQNQAANLVLTGDFNARTGNQNHLLVESDADTGRPGSKPSSYSPRTTQDRHQPNSRGNLLLNLLSETNTTLLNGNTIGDIGGKFTCIKYNGSSVVDYTAVSSQVLNLVSSFTVQDLNSFSDHRPCVTTLNITASRTTCNDIMDPLEDAPIKFKAGKEGAMERYAAEINSRPSTEAAAIVTETLCSSKEETVQLNDSLVRLFIEPALKTFPSASAPKKGKKTRFRPRQPWFDKHCAQAKREVDKQSKIASVSPSSNNRERLFDAKRFYRRLIKQKKREFLEGLTREINNGSINWSKLKNMKNLQHASSLDAFDMRNFCCFFKNLYSEKNRPPGINSANDPTAPHAELRADLESVLNSPVTYEEVKREIKRLKTGKAVACDRIANEFIKACGAPIITALVHLFNQCMTNKVYPWKESVVTPLHKKGCSYDPNNYRAIAVSSNVGKLFSSVLLNRLVQFRSVEIPDPPNQLGFTKGAETADHVLTLRTTIEKYVTSVKGRGARLYSAFIDYSKAFDTVCREALLYKLWKYGVRGNFYGVMEDMYTSSAAKIKLLGKLSERIDILVGTEQGHPMSPELFKIYLYELTSELDQTDAVLPELGGRPLSHLLWADDLVLLALDHRSLQNLLSTLESFCTTWGLTVNLKKTAVMVFNKASVILKDSKTFTYNGNNVPSAKSYCYLGVIFSLNGSFKANLMALRQKAIRSIISLKRAVNLSVLPPDLILKLFDQLILPVASYCNQVWLPITTWSKLNKSTYPDLKSLASDPLEKLHLSFLKLALGVSRKSANVVMWGDTGRTPLAYSLKPGILRYFSRAAEMSEKYPTDSTTVDNTPLLVYAFREQAESELVWYSSIVNFVRKHSNESFLSSWEESRESNRKLSFYNSVKVKFEPEPYLSLERNLAKRVAQIRSASHTLNIERGRFEKYRKSGFSLEKERLCPSCNTPDLDTLAAMKELPHFNPIIEDEPHFLLDCPLYEDLRSRLLPDLSPKLAVVRLRHLFKVPADDAINPVRQTAIYLDRALSRRQDLTRDNGPTINSH